MSRDWIEEKASRLANDLDNGHGEQVAERLRQDSVNMPEEQFARLVHTTQAYERNNYGDDLNVRQVAGGEVVSVDAYRHDYRGIQHRDRIPAGEIQFPPIYDERQGRHNGIDAKSAILGAVIGFGVDRIIQNNSHHGNDNHGHNNDHGNRDDRGHNEHGQNNDHGHRDDRKYPHDDNRRR